MLALDNENCPARGSARAAKAAHYETIAESLVGSLANVFKNHGGYGPVCSYINWAYTESIEMNAQFETDAGMNLDTAYAKCQAALLDIQKEYYGLDASLKGISSNDLRKNLANRLTSWINEQDIANKITPPDYIANQVKWIKRNNWLTTTAGSEAPSYIMFHTNEENLALIAQSLVVGTEFDSFLPLGPSAQIVFEFHNDKPGNLTVKAFIDDVQVTLDGCDAGTINACPAEHFL